VCILGLVGLCVWQREEMIEQVIDLLSLASRICLISEFSRRRRC